MRVAFLSARYFDDTSTIGGGERGAINLARGLVVASGGATTVRIVSYGAKPVQRDLLPGVELVVVPVREGFAQMDDAFSTAILDAIADCDLVHIHQPLTRAGEAGVVCSRLLRKPVCMTDHGSAGSGMAHHLLDLADRIIAESEFSASLLRTRHRVDVVKGGVDGSFFTPPPAPVPRDRVVFVGRLMAHKGIDRLIAALPDDVPLVICGRPYQQDYVRLLRGLATGRPIEIIDDADDVRVRDLYRRAVAVVLSSVYRDYHGTVYRAPEIMGLTLLEGMACGAPGICSRVAAMPEFVDDGVTGYVYDTLEELHDRLNLLHHDSDLVSRLGGAARHMIETKYDGRFVGARVLEIYQELLAGTGQ
jgi:alpha-maltose-1-phosphate synthase